MTVKRCVIGRLEREGSFLLDITARTVFVGMIAEKLVQCTRFQQTQNFMQHGNVSVYEHCIAVAKMSCRIAAVFRLKVERDALIRGALLHDYFLYDWHEQDDGAHRLHGFTHAKTAWRNALQDVQLDDIEADVILRHMFPLTLVPPATVEGWIVCMADKLCALQETFHVVPKSEIIPQNTFTEADMRR